MRTLTYYIATSLDGFISRADGSIDDFGFDGEHVADLLVEYPETIPTHLRSHFEVADECRHFDTVLMGRKTYDVGHSIGFGNPYGHLKQYVITRSANLAHDAAINLVVFNPLEKVRELKTEDGKGIWLCGGPELASVLIDEIDELVLKVNPFLMGAGKSLFTSAFPKRELRLVHRRDYDNGFSLVHYRFQARRGMT